MRCSGYEQSFETLSGKEGRRAVIGSSRLKEASGREGEVNISQELKEGALRRPYLLKQWGKGAIMRIKSRVEE